MNIIWYQIIRLIKWKPSKNCEISYFVSKSNGEGGSTSTFHPLKTLGNTIFGSQLSRFLTDLYSGPVNPCTSSTDTKLTYSPLWIVLMVMLITLLMMRMIMGFKFKFGIQDTEIPGFKDPQILWAADHLFRIFYPHDLRILFPQDFWIFRSFGLIWSS